MSLTVPLCAAASFVDPQRRRACMRVNNPCWRAPEVIEGKPHTKASDVYPFGIILWELLTLRRPFEDEEGNIPDATQIWASVMIHDARPELQDDGSNCASMVCPVAEEYTQLIKRCWDRVPEKRPTYEEILDELVKMQYKVHGRPKKEQYPVPVSALKVGFISYVRAWGRAGGVLDKLVASGLWYCQG